MRLPEEGRVRRGLSSRLDLWGRLQGLTAELLESLTLLFLGLLVFLPVFDFGVYKLFGRGIPAAQALLEHALLLFALASMALASREGRQLALATFESAPRPGEGERARAGWKAAVGTMGAVVAAAAEAGTSAAFFWASLSLVWNGFDPSARVWFIPTRMIAGALPAGFFLMTIFAASRRRGWPRIGALVGALGGSLLAATAFYNFATAIGAEALAESLSGLAGWSTGFLAGARLPLALALLLASLLGAPLFALLGGLALLFLGGAGAWMELAPSEAYALFLGSSLPALPLFALAGFILAESGAGKRFVAVFRELFGWLPGGEALAAVLVSAFFTTFTGASGVTILALGGILAGVLTETGSYSPSFSRGLVAGSGAIGLLLPPSAAMILYGVNAQLIYGEGSSLDLISLFKGGLVPGLLLVLAMAGMGAFAALRRGVRPRSFSLGAAGRALRPALFELATPVIALALFFTGSANLTEVAAIAIIYLVLVESLVKRELGPREILSACRKALPVLGGTLAVLAVARGLSYYLIDAGLPEAFAAWVGKRAASPFAFLLLLNLALLAVGCLMDIYSAILVAAPLVIPLGAAFGLGPVHLGVIFILNLSVGFLTPPVGMSLFLASYAFKRPLLSIYREVIPFLLVQLLVLLVVTYAPLILHLGGG